LIIDSYFQHSGEYESSIGEALLNTGKLSLSIYLASPDKDFGAQRIKEKERPKNKRLTYKQALDESLDDEMSEDYRGRYRAKFNESIDEIKAHFLRKEIRLRIHKYPTMPATRIIAVDDKHYIIGSFPLLGHNPEYFCFYLHDENLTGADLDVVGRPKTQVRLIRRISDQVWPEPASVRSTKRRKGRV